MSRKVSYKKQMLLALEKSLGIVTISAKEVGIDRRTHYRWMLTDESYRKKVEAVEDIALDFAESQLHQQIKKGEVSSTIFYLKTKGKKRGYIERRDITGENGLPIKSENTTTILYIPEKRKEVTPVTIHSNGNGLTHTNGTK